MSSDPVYSEWNRMRFRHPYYGEKKTADEIKKMWDKAAENYNDNGYNEIKNNIIEYLCSQGIIDNLSTIVDIGSGPGTWAKPLSKIVGSILCVDSSQPMLDRINTEEYPNIQTYCRDCMKMPLECKREIALSSLCPQMNSPESLLSMEKYAEKYCVYISSANLGSNMEIEVWQELGKDYSYGGYHTRFPYAYLKSVGRDTAEVRYFSQNWNSNMLEIDAILRLIHCISRYRRVGDEEMKAIRKVVSRHFVDGKVDHKRTVTLGILTWKPLLK